MEAKTVSFKAVRLTKNTIRYEELSEPGKPPVIGVLYVQQHAGTPERIKVTIEANGNGAA